MSEQKERNLLFLRTKYDNRLSQLKADGLYKWDIEDDVQLSKLDDAIYSTEFCDCGYCHTSNAFIHADYCRTKEDKGYCPDAYDYLTGKECEDISEHLVFRDDCNKYREEIHRSRSGRFKMESTDTILSVPHRCILLPILDNDKEADEKTLRIDDDEKDCMKIKMEDSIDRINRMFKESIRKSSNSFKEFEFIDAPMSLFSPADKSTTIKNIKEKMDNNWGKSLSHDGSMTILFPIHCRFGKTNYFLQSQNVWINKFIFPTLEPDGEMNFIGTPPTLDDLHNNDICKLDMPKGKYIEQSELEMYMGVDFAKTESRTIAIPYGNGTDEELEELCKDGLNAEDELMKAMMKPFHEHQRWMDTQFISAALDMQSAEKAVESFHKMDKERMAKEKAEHFAVIYGNDTVNVFIDPDKVVLLDYETGKLKIPVDFKTLGNCLKEISKRFCKINTCRIMITKDEVLEHREKETFYDTNFLSNYDIADRLAVTKLKRKNVIDICTSNCHILVHCEKDRDIFSQTYHYNFDLEKINDAES